MTVRTSALTDAYNRLTEAFPGFTVAELDSADQAPRGGGWVTATSLAEGGAASTPFWRGTTHRCCGTTGAADARTS